jgi:hypothetical protein
MTVDMTLLDTPSITVPTTDWPSAGSLRFTHMDSSPTAITVRTAARRWWKRTGGKPLGEVITDLTAFLMGMAVLYSVDFFIVSRSAPIALRYLIELVIYFDRHAAAAIEIFK